MTHKQNLFNNNEDTTMNNINISEYLNNRFEAARTTDVANIDELISAVPQIAENSTCLSFSGDPNVLLPKMLSDKLMAANYRPVAFGTAIPDAPVVHCSALVYANFLLCVDADGNFLKSNKSLYGASVSASTSQVVQFISDKGAPRIVPDSAVVALLQSDGNGLYEHALVRSGYSAQNAERYKSLPAWSILLYNGKTSEPDPSTTVEWDELRANMGKQIAAGYKAIGVRPGMEVQAIIAGYAQRVTFEPPSSETKEDGSRKYDSGYIGVAMSAWTIYITPLGSRKELFLDERLKGIQHKINVSRETGTLVEMARAVQPSFPHVISVTTGGFEVTAAAPAAPKAATKSPAATKASAPTATPAPEKAAEPAMPEVWKSLSPIARLITMHRLSAHIAVRDFLLEFAEKPRKTLEIKDLEYAAVDVTGIRKLLIESADRVNKEGPIYNDHLEATKYIQAVTKRKEERERAEAEKKAKETGKTPSTPTAPTPEEPKPSPSTPAKTDAPAKSPLSIAQKLAQKETAGAGERPVVKSAEPEEPKAAQNNSLFAALNPTAPKSGNKASALFGNKKPAATPTPEPQPSTDSAPEVEVIAKQDNSLGDLFG